MSRPDDSELLQETEERVANLQRRLARAQRERDQALAALNAIGVHATWPPPPEAAAIAIVVASHLADKPIGTVVTITNVDEGTLVLREKR